MERSLDAIFRPGSVAIVGASRDIKTIGRETLHNMIDNEFQGVVFPVNPKSPVVNSMKCYKSVSDIPDPVDMAVIVVPSKIVLNVIEDCGKKGVKGLVIITAGFKETGEQGRLLEEQLKDRIKHYGMRVVGPNCMGVINTESDVRLNATFAATLPMPGNVAFASQSGALGEAILAQMRELGLGISMFVSLGNKADISGNDVIEYWEDHGGTKLILLYLESFGNPRKFTKIARRITKKKPIIVVKSGRTQQGAKAASSHTGSLAGMDIAVDALFAQTGVLRTTTMEEMFLLATAFSSQPIPGGNNVGILTNAGGPGILATDTCINLGLNVPEISGKTRDALLKILPPEASIANPVDMIASADGTKYKNAIEILLKEPAIDALIVIFVSPIMIDSMEVARGIIEGSRGHKIPILTCFMGKVAQAEAVSELKAHEFPVYQFPEASAYALSKMVKYHNWVVREPGSIKAFDVQKDKAGEIIKKSVEGKREWLSTVEVMAILNAYGISVTPHSIVRTVEDALSFARTHSYPVVLKVNSDKILHKSDVGGVQINLQNEKEIKGAFWEIEQKCRKIDPSFNYLIQKMVTGGKEVIFGATIDPTFGPLMMFGLGGIFVETVKDVSFRLHPITDIDAGEMIREIKTFPILNGIRGEKGVDLSAIEDVLLRMNQLLSDFHEIAEIDINPFFAFPCGETSCAVDGRIKISV